MKKVTESLAKIGAMVLIATGTFAYANANIEQKVNRADNWFEYNQNATDPLSPSSYSPIGNQPSDCEDGNQICAVKTTDSELTEEFLTSIQDELEGNTASEHVVFRN